MIVVIPYVAGKLEPATVEAAGPEAILIYLGQPTPPEAQDEAYWTVLRVYWNMLAGRQDLILIEQDIVVHPEVIPTMSACGHRWCGYRYNFGGENPTDYPMLGCTHFSASLMAERPEAIEQARGGWHQLDQRIKAALGFDQEIHEPPVYHRHRYQ